MGVLEAVLKGFDAHGIQSQVDALVATLRATEANTLAISSRLDAIDKSQQATNDWLVQLLRAFGDTQRTYLDILRRLEASGAEIPAAMKGQDNE
jgi:hypothetical protein